MDYYKIGYIVNTLGIKGELKVLPLSNIPNRFNSLERCYIDIDGHRLAMDVEKRRAYKGGRYIALKFRHYDEIDSVIGFKAKYLEVDRANLAPLQEGHFYVFDVIGCKVYTERNELLGNVKDVLPTGANDVYVVEGEKGEILIPAIKSIVKRIDIASKVIDIQLPEGLIE